MPSTGTTQGFLVHHDKNRIEFRRPGWIRTLFGLSGALLFLLTALLTTVALMALFVPRYSAPGAGAMTLAFAGMLGLLTLFTLTLAGPCEMRFDLSSRTYRVLRGLPLFAGAFEGTFADIDYLYVRSVVFYNYGARTPESRTYLVWKRAPKLYGFMLQPELLLQMLPNIDPAYQQGAEIAGLLGVPLEEGRRKSGAAPAPVPATASGQNAAPKALASGSGEPPAPPSTAGQVGRVTHSEGPLVELQFDPSRMPSVYNAITVTDPLYNLSATATVAQHLPNGVARCILLTPEVRLANGLEAIDSGGPDPRSASTEALLQSVSIICRDRATGPTLLETGLKAIDLLCPIPSGGKAGVFAEWGVSALVLVPEMAQVLDARPGGLSLFTFLHLQTDSPRWQASMAELPLRSGEKQFVYFPVEDPNDAAFRARFTLLDSIIHLSRRLSIQGLYPPIDPQSSRSRLLEEARVGADHLETADAVRRILLQYQAFQPTLEATTLDTLPASDRAWVSRARKIERFLTQPFFVAEPYTGIPGKSVPLTETIRGCKAILSGAYDDLPEQSFYMIGGIEEAISRAST